MLGEAPLASLRDPADARSLLTGADRRGRRRRRPRSRDSSSAVHALLPVRAKSAPWFGLCSPRVPPLHCCRDPSGVGPVPAAAATLSGVRVYSSGGVWIAEFSRPFAAGASLSPQGQGGVGPGSLFLSRAGAYSGAVAIGAGAAASTLISAVGSYGSAGSGTPGTHTATDRAVGSVVFSTVRRSPVL